MVVKTFCITCIIIPWLLVVVVAMSLSVEEAWSDGGLNGELVVGLMNDKFLSN